MYTLSPTSATTRHLPVNDPLVTLRVTLVNNPLNNPVFKYRTRTRIKLPHY